MPNKQAIIENVDMYSADELVKFIKAGVVTFDELCEETEGYFSAPVRKEVEKKLAGSEDEDWEKAKSSNSIEDVNNFLSAYPNSIHKSEALKLIAILKNRIDNTRAETDWESVNKSSIDSLREFCRNFPNDVHCKEAKRIMNQIVRDEVIGYDVDSLKVRIKEIETSKEINKNKLI